MNWSTIRVRDVTFAISLLLLIDLCENVQRYKSEISSDSFPDTIFRYLSSQPYVLNETSLEYSDTQLDHNRTIPFYYRPRNRTEEDEILRDEDVLDEEFNETQRVVYDGRITNITMSTEEGKKMYKHWIDQAMSGLLAAIATNKIPTVTEEVKVEHQKCANRAKSVKNHAACVVMLLDAEKKIATKKREEALQRVFSKRINYFRRPTSWKKNPWKTTHKIGKASEKNKELWSGSFKYRAKRSTHPYRVVHRNSYNLPSNNEESPVAAVAKRLTRTIRRLKNKELNYQSWPELIREIRKEGEILKKRRDVKKQLEKRFSSYMRVLKGLGADDKGPMSVMGMDSLMDDVEPMDEDRAAAVKRMEKHMTPEEKMMREPIKIIREGVKLGMKIAGEDVSDFDNKTINMISPRIMSLMPEEQNNHTINLLSPSLLSLHNEGTGLESSLSISKAIGYFEDKGHQELMNFIMEASGVSDAVNLMKDLKFSEQPDPDTDRKMRGMDGQPLWFTKNNITDLFGQKETNRVEHFERLQNTFTDEQMREMNVSGFSILSRDQIDFLYGDKSPYNHSETHERLREMSEKQIRKLLMKQVRTMANHDMEVRMDLPGTYGQLVVLQSFVNQPELASAPIVLSPVLLTPLINSPSIFGPVILSPWAFVPVIVSPRILGPVVLSPILFSPVVLSPVALVPLVLSPGLGVPFVLSPFVLNPFILSPVALTPLILSPFCLSPFIIIPNVLSPLILSPFVLSPLILSPPAVSAFVLNPYALSPIIQSPGWMFSAVLSPSWMSKKK